MRLLFDMDLHDYGSCTRSFVRNSARSIIIRDGKIAMIHSLKYDYSMPSPSTDTMAGSLLIHTNAELSG